MIETTQLPADPIDVLWEKASTNQRQLTFKAFDEVAQAYQILWVKLFDRIAASKKYSFHCNKDGWVMAERN